LGKQQAGYIGKRKGKFDYGSKIKLRSPCRRLKEEEKRMCKMAAPELSFNCKPIINGIGKVRGMNTDYSLLLSVVFQENL
jgi:hypothetical protein